MSAHVFILCVYVIYTGGYPYPSVSNSELLPALVNGYRLECPKNCSTDMYETFRI